jgi:hypothetical protein
MMTRAYLGQWLLPALLGILISLSPGATHAQDSHIPYVAPPSAKVCRPDRLVWVNTSSGRYLFRNNRLYGRTRNGEYMCRRDADHIGYRPASTGQHA